jgi:hypothetical protein
MKTLFAIFSLSILCSAAYDTRCDGADDIDWEKRAESTSWRWPDREPSLFISTMRANEPYQILLEHIWNQRFLVHISQKEKVLLKFKAHDRTVFEIFGHTLVYADFNAAASGCVLVGVDLANGKEKWRTPLKGIGPIDHSRYSNHVALTRHVGVVQVSGWESAGKYYEYIDLETGKSLGHRLFEKGFE